MSADDTREFYGDKTRPLPRTVAVRSTRRIVVGIVGGLVTAFGIVLLVTPGPGLLVIILGLTILSWEFVWAKRMKMAAKQKLNELRKKKRQD